MAMFTNLSPRAKAATFAVIVLLAQCGVCVAMRSTGELAATVAMFTPAATVLIMLLVVTRDGWHRSGWAALGLHRAGFRYWPFAILAPIVVLVSAEFVVVLTGLGRADFSSWPAPAEFAFEVVADLVIISGFAFFEEIGWRGYLLPLVNGRFAAAKVGFLHGLWHLPIVFLVAGAYLTEGNRWLTVPLFLAVLTTAGVLYGWLRERSGSVWPAVLVHGAFNLALGYIADTVVTHDLPSVSLIGRETGVATLGALVLLTLWVHQKRRSSARASAISMV